MSPTTNTSGWPGQGEVGQHLRPGRPGPAGAGLLGELPAERARGDAGGPDLGDRLDPPPLPSRSCTTSPVASTSTTIAPSCTSMPRSLQVRCGLLRELAAERAEHRVGAVDQHDPGGARVDPAEVAGQRPPGQLGDLAGHLDAGRAGADHGEGEQPVDLRRVVGQLGELERAEDAAAQLEGVVDALEPRRVLGELVVAEVRLRRAGRDDQAVVRRARSRRARSAR